MLQVLKQRTQSAEKESTAILDKSKGGELGADDFLRSFRSARKAYHLSLAQTERLAATMDVQQGRPG